MGAKGQPKTPATIGRPSVWSDAYCDEVISYMASGYSITAFAGMIGVSRETIYAWKREKPLFSDALTKAHAKRMLWWEERLKGLASDGTGNAAAIIFALKNLSPEDWRDKHEIVQSGTITHTHGFNEEAMSAMSRDELEAFSGFATKLLSAPVASKPDEKAN